MNVVQVPLDVIGIDENQPRKYFDEDALNSLKESILEEGIRVPLLIRKELGYETGYLLVDGERRFRVAVELDLEDVPCIVEETDGTDVEIFETQLRLDCLKEKLSSEELDNALHKYWGLLGNLSEEDIPIPKTNQGDWRIPYMSKRIGISYTRIKMALDKQDFKERNREFHKKIKDKIENSGESEKENKKYNRILEETNRIANLRNNDETRKEIIDEYIKENVPDNTHELREKLREISETEQPSRETIANILGTPINTNSERHRLVNILEKFNKDLEKEKDNLNEQDKVKLIELLKESLEILYRFQ